MPIAWLRKKDTSPAELLRRNVSFFHKATTVPPYSKLAPVYDYLMRHVDYERWARYILRLLEKARVEAQTVLDISCGTGSLALQLAARGLQAFGLDASVEMVREACAKARRVRGPAWFWVGDMTRFAVARPVDVVVSTYDSLNYCLDLECVSRVFERVEQALRPGGVFIFDVCTERNSRRNFQHYRENDEFEGWEYVRRAYYDPRNRLQVNEFLLRQQKSGEWYYEKHAQRIYRLRQIRQVVPPQLAIVGVFDDFSFANGSEKSDRVHFMLRKDGSAD